MLAESAWLRGRGGRGGLTGGAALLVLLVAALMVLWASPAWAASFTVNSTADEVDANPGDGTCAAASGACTLRAAVMETNALEGADTVAVPAGTYTLTIPVVTEFVDGNDAVGDLDIKDDLTINGAGARTTVVDGGGLDRVFDVPGRVDFSTDFPELLPSDAVVGISGVTITGGNAGPENGGGIRNTGPGLTLTESTVSGNASSVVYGGPGDDAIDGGRGADRLFGEGGNDALRGGPGRDRLAGGPGLDLERQ
jgi:CSLREA domain-containing protein